MFFKVDEVKIITADGHDVGWIQEQDQGAEIFVGSFCVTQAMQRHGIGTQSAQRRLHVNLDYEALGRHS